MKANRGHERFFRRLETEFEAQDKKYRGISSNLSISGLFIRTQHAFVPNTLIDIVIHLPGTPDVKLKGKVRHSIKTPVISIKNGMGVEIIENDPQYINFVKSVYPDSFEGPASEGSGPDTSSQENIQRPLPDEPLINKPLETEFTIITCLECGAKNKVSNAKLSFGPKCGKCRNPLTSKA